MPEGGRPLGLAGWLVALPAWGLLLVARSRDRTRAALVAEAGHELRGPLCAARLALEGVGAGRPEWARRVAAADLELQRAGRALDDLAAAGRGTRSEAGDAVVPVDVSALLARAAPGWRALARAHGAELAVGEGTRGVIVLGDAVRLVQGLGNLVANAAEHGGGTVRVDVRASGSEARLEVADGGVGLPAPVAALAAAGRRGAGRRGHGLAVAERIARGHGGRLAAAPAATGARLVLELPRVAAGEGSREVPA